MMRASRLLLPFLLTLGCAHAPAASEPAKAAVSAHPGGEPAGEDHAVPTPAPDTEAAVRQLLATQVAAWNRGDLEGYLAGYWNSPKLTFFSGGAITTGWDQTLARYRQRYQGEGKAMGTLDFANLEVEVIGSDAALARGRWVLRFGPPVNKRAQGLFSVVLRRLPEGWRVVHDHSSAE